MTHDKNGKQIKKNPDISDLPYLATLTPSISSQGEELLLPIGEIGIWLLRIKAGGFQEDSFVIRSHTGVIDKEGDNEMIFWGQDFRTKRSITDGTLKILNLQDDRREIFQTNFDGDGIAKAPVSLEADIALIQLGDYRDW